MSSPADRIRHVPALDGLRGLALLGVLLFHARGALEGGYLGVDLFFVLSGYLITSLLLAERAATGRVALSAFWVRRARRLFPALLSLMPAIAVYCRFFAKPEELAGVRGDALATLGYVANWRAILSEKSYWELFQSPSPLEHTWSLSIEEQFYVVWPLLVALLAFLFKRTRRAVLMTSLALLAASIAAMLVLYDPERVSRVYLGTDTRAAGILAGAAFACVAPPGDQGRTLSTRAVRARDALGVLGAALLAYAWCTLEGEAPLLYRGGLWVTELAALALIACAVAGPRSVVARALAFRPLAWLGTISYGAYLWHWPIDVVMTDARVHLGAWLPAAQIALTLAIAVVSYRFFERPIRARGVPFGRPAVVVPSAVALAVLLVVRASRARDLPPPPPAPPVAALDAPDAGPEPIHFRAMLLGDSTANSLGWALRGVHEPGVAIELMGKDGCTMLADTCNGEHWVEQTREVRPDATLLFVGGAFLHGTTARGRWLKACKPEWDTKFETYVKKRVQELAPLDSRVWLVTLPYPLGPYDSADFRAEVDCINARLRKIAKAVPGVEVLELGERLCPNGVCQRELNGIEIRPDGVHYCIEGMADVSRWALDELQKDRTPEL